MRWTTAKNYPFFDNLVAIQKGIGSCIELIKDLIDLYKSFKARETIMADTKKYLLKIGENAKTALDLTNRLITLYQSQGQLRTGQAVWKKANAVKDYISAAKYLIEAVLNFAQFGLSICDESDDRHTMHDANALAIRQLSPTGGGKFNPNLAIFAKATQSDLINIIHSVNSSVDAAQMTRLANDTLRGLPGEIERLKGSLERHEYFWQRYRQQSEQKKVKLRESQRRLLELRKSLINISDQAAFRFGGSSQTQTNLVRKIDELDGKIDRIVNPVPNTIPPRRRLGPSVSPI